ncbi:MAG: efflux RND transporter periplasmic adaptor subunit [Planctomycetes bacterium]|jgi:RND family efflux transporter MFP subunit|nr:efflux RND transporter periplasmic adaptor subunit [Planctomycetota bacterium]
MLTRTIRILFVLAVVTSWSPDNVRAGVTGGIRAVTRPSADVTMAFVQPGRIAAVHFKEGDSVKTGQVLVQQDDAAEQVLLTQLKAQSEDTTQIRASEASLAQKKVDLAKLEKAALSNAATALEVEHARLDVTIADLSLELARFEHEQAARKYQEQKTRVENLQIKSPIDGTIEKIDVEVGESATTTAQAIQVVRTDPLWIDVPVPLAQALALKAGGTAQVVFGAADKPAKSELGPTRLVTTEGRIIFVAAVADAASGTLRVRIETPNQARRPAGEHVLITF